MSIKHYSSKSIEKELERRGIYLIDGKRVDLRGYTLAELEQALTSRLKESTTNEPKPYQPRSRRKAPLEKSLKEKPVLYEPMSPVPKLEQLQPVQESQSYTPSTKSALERLQAHLTRENKPVQREPDPEWLVSDKPDKVEKPKKKERVKSHVVRNGKREKITIRRAEDIIHTNGNHYSTVPTSELWKQYKSNPTEEMKKYFMEKYLPLVKYHADKISTRVPANIDVEDLISVGIFGLVDAIDAFDLERKVRFETYAVRRIVGEMLDELRHRDWIPRNARQGIKRLEAIQQEIKKETGENPSLEQIQEKLGTSDEEFKKIHQNSSARNQLSLSQRITMKKDEGSREVRESDRIRDRKEVDPLDEIQKKDLQKIITKGLDRAERLIIVCYYYENMTMKEIGRVLDLSESRVSQIHTNLMNRFKNQMRERGLEDQLAEAANGRQYE